jgi:trans-aconitate 2-methyltransferase
VAEGYTFGDTALAAERLAVVAEVFASSSRRLMVESIPQHADVVLDLGCGPGHSTRLLAEACAPRRLVGLDASGPYISLARRLANNSGIEFAVHSVTDLPFPWAPADAVFARFLLSHLANPLQVVEDWRGQLRPAGVLVLDEVQEIDAPPGPLRAYIELAARVVATGGGSLYSGELLRSLGGRVVELLVPSSTASRMFAMNLEVWRSTALKNRLADAGELDELADNLKALADHPQTEGVRWVLRQLVMPA